MADLDLEHLTQPSYRAGSAARLAGLSVETLRVWERRYNITGSARSEHGQRLYSQEQVARLALIKKLVDQGHAVSTLAHLSSSQLQDMLSAPSAIKLEAGALRAVVIGGAALCGMVRSEGTACGLQLLHAAERSDAPLPELDADVLIVEANLPVGSDPAHLLDLRARIGARGAVLLYRFGQAAALAALREHGFVAARAPVDLPQLATLCVAACGATSQPTRQAGPLLPPRLFDDAALRAIEVSPNSVACECPRHLTEVIRTVAAFERYSADCENANPQQAALHAELAYASAQARALLEAALVRLARADGLPLPPTL